ncbi:hypothetical protein ON010_g785 [Phytophthora cinnamomi]|nr:hypothetical protein ON010_g785 [Phytophthora cinnamomi]
MRSSSFGTPATTRPPYDKWICHLSKNELHAATCEYDRVRGHFQGLNFDRFRDTVVIEALAGFPEYFAQRLFREWNVSGDGELSRSEFIAAAAAAGKSLRGDHIEMVFRMISANGDGTNVSRSDVARFLKCFDPGPHFMGIDRRTTSVVRQSWAGDKFLRMLFGSSTTERLTLEKLGTVLGSSTAFDAFIEWIPNLGARLLCPQDDFVPHAAVIQRFTDFKLFHVRNAISLKQREEFRSELRTILFILSTESPSLTSAYIIDRFRDVLDEDSLIDTIVTAWNIANAGKDLNSSDKLEAPAVREEFKLFVLGYCCAHASSVHQVYRLLFELFDEDRCGQIEVEQLSAFLQLAVDLSPIDSEREANIIIRRRGRSHSPSLSPPPSPHGLSITPSGSPQILSLHQFIEVAQDLPGFSLAEIETAFLLFHIKQHGSQIRRDSSPDMIGDDHLLLMNLFDDYFSEETAQSFAFCLLSPKEWQQLMNGIMRCPNDLSAAQILHQEAIELPSGHMMLTLPVWLLTSFWYGMKPRESLKFSANWASSIHLYRGDQSFLHGFWIRISINFTSCDGFERVATIPQVIAFEQCNVRSVLNAALSQKGWGGHDEEETSGVTTMCQCQVLIAQRNDAGEIKT